MAANWRRWRGGTLLLPSWRHLFLMLYFGDWVDGSLGLFNWQNTANVFHITATFTLYCKIIYIWLPLGYSHLSFFFFFKFPDSDVLMNKILKEYKLRRFFFFPPFFFISCISCYAHVLCMFLQRLDEILYHTCHNCTWRLLFTAFNKHA